MCGRITSFLKNMKKNFSNMSLTKVLYAVEEITVWRTILCRKTGVLQYYLTYMVIMLR